MSLKYESKKNKYDSKFCSLIGANANLPHLKSTIMNILISNAKHNNKSYEFSGELKDYLNKIHSSSWGGYKKTTLLYMLDTLVVKSTENINEKYVIISSNKSNIIVSNINIIL